MAIDPNVRVATVRAGKDSGAVAIGVRKTSVSWRLDASRNNVRQLGYELQIASDPAFTVQLAESGFVRTGRLGAAWIGPELASRAVRWARVRVHTDVGLTEWSSPLRIEAALLSAEDWLARPISPKSNVDRKGQGPAPLFRRTFRVSNAMASARLYVSALGVHETWINGVRVGNAMLDPGWTSYQARLLYAAYDVTSLLRDGDNAIAASVGDGWWRGRLTWMDRQAVYGATTAFLAQLEIITQSGERLCIATDESWRGGYGDILNADLYDGSARDLRKAQIGWMTTDFDDAEWEAVDTLPLPAGLELRSSPPVRVVNRLSVNATRTGRNVYRIDAGQNLAGVVRLRARGQSGARIEVRHAEILDNEGELFTAALRTAKATDSYVLASDESVELEPAFTFHGFRYAEIKCSDGVVIESAEIAVVSSDLEQIGAFACSDDRVTKLFQNVRWSQLSNFLALPTDCPQRDERLGWTGDIQVFAAAACANADAYAFLASWLKDLAIEQRADGCVPSTAPNVLQDFQYEYAGVGWGDAATLVPWELYRAYGDAQVLHDQYESMRAWVDHGASRLNSDGVWVGDFQLGDWLDPAAPPDQPEKGATDRDFIATAYLSRSAEVVARASALCGNPEREARYRTLSRDIAAAAWRRWRSHALTTQTACALAIEFGIAPEAEIDAVAEALASLVERSNGRIGTGFLGTPLVLPALTRGGRLDAAYRLLLNEECPGWLYQVKQGATTIWERWDAVRADGRLHTGEMAVSSASMTSFNHYAYGAVAAWLYETVAGLAPCENEPGYACVRLAPRPGGGLNWARAALRTPYGRCSIEWEIKPDNVLDLKFEIPPGSVARLSPPPEWKSPNSNMEYGSGRHTLTLQPFDVEI